MKYFYLASFWNEVYFIIFLNSEELNNVDRDIISVFHAYKVLAKEFVSI